MAKALTMADLMGTATEQTVTTGSTINGKILSVKKNEILIDMGPHGVGLVPRREIGFGKKYNVGDEVVASVIDPELPNGQALLSLRKAAKERGWDEIQKVVDFVSSQVEQHFDTKVVLEKPEDEEEPDDGKNSFPDEEFDDDGTADYVRTVIAKYLQPGDDENVKKALDIIIREGKASTSYLQRRMGIGYNKAAEIIDRLEQRGIVSAPLPGGQKRDILVFDELGKPD